MDNTTKSILTSKTIWTLAVGLLANILTIAGVHVLDDTATQLEVVNVIMALMASFFRFTSTQQFHVIPPAPPLAK